MISRDINAAHPLIDYVWKILKDNEPGDWSETNYGGIIPIVPVADSPELEEYDWPHIVYGYAEGFVRETVSGYMTLTIHDASNRRISRTSNLLKDVFSKRHAARSINNFTSNFGGPTKPYVGLRFLDVGVSIEGVSPEDSEGGKQEATVILSYTYTATYKEPVMP